MKKWLAFLWLGALAAPATAQPQTAQAPREPVPLAVFARLPEMQQVRLSTDGKALAFRIRVNGEQALAVLPLDEPNARPQIVARDAEFDQSEGYRTQSWNWIDPDNLIIQVGQRTDLEGQRVLATRVISYNRRTRVTTRLGWEGTFVRSNLLWMSHEGPPRILLSRLPQGRGGGFERLSNPEVIEVDVATGRVRLVQQQRRGVTAWYADGAGNVRMGMNLDADSGRLTVYYRPGGDGNFRSIIRERTERYQEPPVPIAFLPGDRALATSRHEGFRALYEIDLNTMEFVRKVYGLPNYDIDDVDLNVAQNAVEGIDVTEDRSRTVWMSRACARSSRRWMRPSGAATRRSSLPTGHGRTSSSMPGAPTRPAPIISTISTAARSAIWAGSIPPCATCASIRCAPSATGPATAGRSPRC